MALVIAEPCTGCKDQSCIPVCPVDAIHGGVFEQQGQKYDQFFIDPDACICCSLCETECPVDAVFQDDEVPAEWSRYTEINATFFRQPKPSVRQDISVRTTN